MKFSDFVDKIFWGLITGISLYASTQLQKMSESVSLLNTNIAVIVTKMQAYESQSEELKDRVITLEGSVFKIPTKN